MIPYLPPIQLHDSEVGCYVFVSKPIQHEAYYHNSNIDFVNLNRDQFTQNFVDYIKSMENSIRKGYNKFEDRWYPVEEPNGELVIAYGHKVTSGNETGISDSEAIRLLHNDLETSSRTVKSYVSSHFGAVNLTNDQIEMLTEFAFQLGSLDSFPKFTEAVVKQDWKTVREEYKRSYVDGNGNRHELTNRNLAFFDRYLASKDL